MSTIGTPSGESTTGWEPLYLSTIAGLSTCIGAAVVFCQPSSSSSSSNNENNTKVVKVVPPKTMAFSLALAGSVMVTVSVISILPEVLMKDNNDEDINNDPKDIINEETTSSYQMIDIFSWDMFYRILFFTLGCTLYFGLSLLLHVPDPEDVLDQVLKLDQSTSNHSHGRHSSPSKIVDDTNDDDVESNTKIEMKSLLSTPSKSFDDTCHENTMTNITSDCPPSPLLRERRNNQSIMTSKQQQLPQRNPSPGDNNGKVKSLSPSSITSTTTTPTTNKTNVGTTPNLFSLKTWTKGEDLNTNEQKKAWRVAILLFVSLLVHNFPEGLAVAASALESSKLGVTVTIGIMVHNIPEGIAIAIPCLAARPDKPWLSFILASVSGLAEPMGAFVALLFLRDIDGNNTSATTTTSKILNLENILSFVAGIMIMVALWELFPEAKRHATDTMKYFWYGTVSGVIIMVLTELYLP